MEKEVEGAPVLSDATLQSMYEKWSAECWELKKKELSPEKGFGQIVAEAQRDAAIAYYEPIIKTLRGEPLELSDDWENNLYRNIVHTLVETENMIPGGQAERVMKVCKALYDEKLNRNKGD